MPLLVDTLTRNILSDLIIRNSLYGSRFIVFSNLTTFFVPRDVAVYLTSLLVSSCFLFSPVKNTFVVLSYNYTIEFSDDDILKAGDFCSDF